MALQQSDGASDGFNDINITPFVDIVLVLLVIFMVTAKYIASQAIPVDLPKAASAASGISTVLSCSIDAHSQMFLDKVPMSPEELRENLKSRSKAGGDIRAVINADRTVPHGRVVELIDIIRTSGIEKFAIQTELPPAKQ